MHRRQFLAGAAGAALAGRLAWAQQLPRDLRVTRIVQFDLTSRRPKFVGKNSRRDDHGQRATDRIVRIYTSAGVQALGNCRADRDQLSRLLRGDPLAGFRADPPRIAAPLGAGTMPLWDLAGKLLDQPVYRLLGARGPQRVAVYDGSIYFSDLLPQYRQTWRDRFRQELDMGLDRGHRAFKVKIGRGAHWMDRREGDARDIEVLDLIRRHVGPDVLLAADANNGYDLQGAQRLLDAVADVRLAFVEEMFPEDVEHCLALKAFIAQRGWNTLVADGETQATLDVFRPFIAARAIDLYQADMNRFGIEGILDEADMVRPQQLQVAPHNWGSLLGFIMQLHVGRAITNFYRAECDTLDNDVLVWDGYRIAEGVCSVPDAPGLGITLREEAFARDVTIVHDLRA